MNRRVIMSGVTARNELARGGKFLAEAVAQTLGPFGSNWFLDKGKRPTNDGVKIAKEIQLYEEIQNLGVIALREAAIKTNDEVGDGTTTAITLAYAIYQAATRFLSKDGVVGQKTPAEVVKQIETERKEIEEKLKALATPIETKEDLINSAIVSVEDKELGTLIGEAQWEVGKDGYLLAEETAERISTVEKVRGIRIDNGSGTSMVFNNPEKGTLELVDMPIILTSYTIKDFGAIEGVLNKFLKSGKHEIAIIARAWTEEGILACRKNHENGFKIYPLNAPYMDMQQRFLDLEAVTGAKFYDSESTDLSSLDLQDIGLAKKIRATRYDAIIAGSEDILTQARIGDRVKTLEKQFEGSQSDFEKKNLRERIAQLTGGFAIVKVGSPSEMERKRLFDKCEDAVNAVRAAFQEGTVKGAGLAFKEISDSLHGDYILKRPLLSIYEQIMFNAPKDFVVEDWVRDPVKVMRIALENACNAAASFATAGGAICQANPKELDQLLKPVSQQE